MNWQEIKDNPKSKQRYDQRMVLLRATREFFWLNDFLEAETPLAVKTPSQEPYLNPLPIEYVDPFEKNFRFYLHTSPEYALKKLLCAGYNKLFEICKCFRNNEDFGGTHNPEFTMIEWYRSPGKIEDIMDDLENLFKYLGKKVGQDFVVRENKKIPINIAWERIAMKDLWKKFINTDLNDYLEIGSIKSLVKDLGYDVSDSDEYEDLFFKIFLNKIEPNLGWEKPVIVFDYPSQMSSLSQLCDDMRYAKRFECYIGGLEICNAFGELTDGAEQEKRLEKDKDLRKKLGKEIFPIDKEFISALKSGMAPAGGIALGFDRVVMLFTGVKDINDVIFMSAKDQTE